MHVKDKKDGEPVHMDWDQSQAALRTGNFEIADEGSGDEETRSEKIVPDLVAPAPPPKPAPMPAPVGREANAS